MVARFSLRVCSLLCVLVLSIPQLGLAQAPETKTAPPPQQNLALPAGLTSCFDYYRFGSTPIAISGSLSTVSPGSTLGITGTIKNDNPYPLFGVKVFSKLFKIRNGGKKDANGPDVLSVTEVAKDLIIKAGESQPLSFTVPIPQTAESGDYQVATFVTSMDRFNMLGLSFTDDIIGGIYNFAVAGGKGGAVRFAKNGVEVNGQPYLFASYPPRIASTTKEVSITAKLTNTTDSPTKGTVTWKLYSWDSGRKENLLDEQTAPVKLLSTRDASASYVVTDTTHSVYYLEGTLTTDTKDSSTIGVRFVRENIFTPRINFVGVSEYPTTDKTVALACVHSTGIAPAENSELVITVTPTDALSRFLGTKGESKTYTGTIPGELSALTMPAGVLQSSFDVTATLSQNGATLDTVTVSYTCDMLGTTCTQVPGGGGETRDSTPRIMLATLVLALILAGIALYAQRKQKKTTPPNTLPHVPRPPLPKI